MIHEAPQPLTDMASVGKLMHKAWPANRSKLGGPNEASFVGQHRTTRCDEKESNRNQLKQGVIIGKPCLTIDTRYE